MGYFVGLMSILASWDYVLGLIPILASWDYVLVLMPNNMGLRSWPHAVMASVD